MMRMTQLLCYGLLVSTAVGLTGCGSYVIQGKVVPGPVSMMTFVAPDDMLLSESGMSDVRVTLRRDPDRLSTRVVGSVTTGGDGKFSLHVDELGAGWMEEQWLVVARKPRFRNASWNRRLTMKHRKMRLLVTLAPGHSTPGPHEDLMDQFEQFQRPGSRE